MIPTPIAELILAAAAAIFAVAALGWELPPCGAGHIVLMCR